jgi:hypothetical protein
LGDELFRYLLLPEPTTGCRLEPDLLLRHASGQLYQEAHLRLERECRQAFLPGMASDASTGGLLTKDVRFTPPSLARALVEQALTAARDRIREGKSARLDVLDPACGSGVFLQETLRELVRRKYCGQIMLRGFDTSPISCAISRFCLERIKQDLPRPNVSIVIKQQDSLQTDWGKPDLILMNPPFMPWDRMEDAEKEAVRNVLGVDLAKFRVDLAMAFIWKAVESLAPTASLATVLPAPLFETDSGMAWRDKIKEKADLLFLGRFAGYGFFRGSTVEPGMLVLRRKDSAPSHEHSTVWVLVAKSGFEDAAIRGLRRDTESSSSLAGWDVFTVQERSLSSASWMPRFRDSMQLVETLTAAGMTRVEDLFIVHQGIRTGNNKAFVLSAKDHESLPSKEKKYFKPVASNSTIRDGIILADKSFVFYPYDASGAAIATVEELKSRVPRYYGNWLSHAEDSLKARGGIDQEHWWLLTRHRSWQVQKRPKLTTTYFGYRGNFAYDDTGEFVVLQGYAWLWKRKTRPTFDKSPLPWAYLTILNSRVFETLLESTCPRVQGGQFNLSTKFVSSVFLPDLADDARYAGSLVEKLAKLGRQIHNGHMPELDVIDELAAQAYGMPVDRLVQDSIV